MNVKELDDLYESGFYSIVCANLSSNEANIDITETNKNLNYLNEMDAVKTMSSVPKSEWHMIKDAINLCKNHLTHLENK